MGSGKDVGGTPGLSVRLLGGFSVSTPDGPVAIESARLRSLLAHLLLESGQDLPRARLAYAFWPASAESQARTNMRQALHRLRQTLPDADVYLKVGKSTVSWRVDSPTRLDVAEFEALASSDDRTELERALELYGGDLFPECYDDWIAPWRERLRAKYLLVAESLAERIELERDYRRAVPLARRILDDDPANEEALRRLMRLYALSGDRSAALQAHHDFATTLAREMGVEPSPETQAAYELLVEPAASRVSGEPSAGLVGREAEWEKLRAEWRSATQGKARFAAITGEAGIGKSRLAEELRAWVARQGFRAAFSRCYAGVTGLAYAPLTDFLRSEAVAPGLAELADAWLTELSRLVPELLEERRDIPRPAPLTDDLHRTRLFDAISRAVLGAGEPLLLVVDDIQWCDEETVGWLRYLLRSEPSAPILVLATARSEEFHSEHPAQKLLLEGLAVNCAIRVDLEALDPEETTALAASVAGRELGDEGGEQIFKQTEGNPLFVIEWTRAGLADEPAPVPPRVQSVIETRFSRLSKGGQELASLAATVGRAFEFGVLASASSRSEDDVIDALDELTDRRIVRELRGGVYDFSHDKLREAAYERVGEARRQMLHRRVAQAIESRAADLDAVAGELGVHYEKARWADRAASFYARAAEAAHRVYSNERAIALFEKALSLLADEPETPERDRRELALRTALGAPLVSIEGYGAARVHDDYLRAEKLCERLGTPPAPPVLRGLALVALARSELERAREFGEQLLAAGVSDDEPTVRVEGHYVLGVTSFWLGEFERAREQLEASLAEYDPAHSHDHVAMYSQDPKVICLSRLALVLHYLGDADAAGECAREALRYADEVAHPWSLAYALNFTAWLAIDRGEKELARERAERMASLADDEQLGFVHPMGTILRGWLLGQSGATDEAITLIHEGLDAYEQSGWSLYRPYALTLLARICVAAGRKGEAREAVAEALDVSNQTGQRYLDTELRELERALSVA